MSEQNPDINSENSIPLGYISSREASNEHRVTHDYIARLCRQGKVRGMLVGRNWFVDRHALSAYLTESRLRRTRTAATLARTSQEHHEPRRPIKKAEPRPVLNLAAALALIPDLQDHPNKNRHHTVVAAAVAAILFVGGTTAAAHMGALPMSAAVAQVESPFFASNPVGKTIANFISFFFGKKDAETFAIAPVEKPLAPARPTSRLPTPGVVTLPKPPAIIQTTYPVAERRPQTGGTTRAGGWLTPETFVAIMGEFNTSLRSEISRVVSGSLDKDSSVVTLTAADIPDLSASYFPATSTIALAYGGTGTSTYPSYGQLLLGNAAGGYDLVATSSLGITASAGGGTFAYTPTTNYGAAANATSTPIWFQTGLQASSTARFVSVNATAATSTNLYTSLLGLNSEYFSDLTGSGLTNTGGALTLNTSGDWTGTFDNQEGSYYLANSFSTTSADVWKTARNFFATSSADYWEGQQVARTSDDLTNNSIEDLSDVAAMTKNYGDLLSWNGSSWSDVATSSLFQNATANTSGLLTSGDFTTFNNKISSTSLSGTSVISYNSSTGVITTQGGTFGAGAYVFPSTVTAPFASSTALTVSGTASTSALIVSGLNAASCDVKAGTDGTLSCGTDATGAGGSYPFTPGLFGATAVSATTTALQLQAGLFASSTVTFGNAGVSGFQFAGATGKLGLGTTTPFAKFSLHALSGETNTTLFAIGSSTASATATLFSISNTGTATFGDSTGTGNATMQFASDANAWSTGYFATDKSFRIASSTELSTSVALTIAKGGNVGIGTTSPTYKLSVEGESTLGNIARAGYFIATSSTASVFPFASTTAITATHASTTNLTISSVLSGLLKTNSTGGVVAAVAGTDYANFAYPFPSNATTTQLAFNGGLTAVGATTTALSVSGTGYFSLASTSALTISDLRSLLLSTDGTGRTQATTVSAPLSFVNNALSISQANENTNGYLSSTDWNLFNYKVSSSSLSTFTSTFKDWSIQNGALSPTTTLGIVVAASSTIGSGTQAGGLTISGGATTTGNAYFAGNVGVGTTTFSVGTLAVEGSILASTQFFGNASDTIITPSFSWRGDSRTGMYHPASNTIGFTTNSTEKLRITSTGDVGIGTTSPWAQLSVNPNGITGPAFAIGSSTATNFVVTNAGNVGVGATPNTSVDFDVRGSRRWTGLFINTGTTNATQVAVDAESTGAGTLNTGGFFYAANATTNYGIQIADAMTAGANNYSIYAGGTAKSYFAGNVGIGTTTPSAKLGINNGSVTSVSRALVIEGLLNAVNAGHSIDWFAGSSNTGAAANAYARIAGVTDANGNGGELTFYTNSNLGSSAATESLRINRLGNVGIGTTTPDEKLNVRGNVTLQGPSLGVGSLVSSLDFRGYNGYSSPMSAAIDSYVPTGSPGVDFQDLRFYTANATAERRNERMRINPAGLVGIGTTTPVSTLSIQGSLCVRATGSCGTTAGTIYATTAAVTDIDLAENYITSDPTLMPGEIAALDTTTPAVVRRAQAGDQPFGIVSTKPGLLLGKEISNAKPIALKGRVPLKVNLEGGPIEIGDVITLSSEAGVGTKATTTAQKVGIALESWSGTGTTTIEVFVDSGLHFAPEYIASIDLFTASSTQEKLESPLFDTFFKNIFARMSMWFADAGNGIANVFVGRLEAKQEICVDGECLTKEDIRILLNMSRGGGSVSSTATPAPQPAPTPTPEPQPTPTPAPEPEPTPEPEPAAEPAPEPASTPAPEPTPAPTPAPIQEPAPEPAPAASPSSDVSAEQQTGGEGA